MAGKWDYWRGVQRPILTTIEWPSSRYSVTLNDYTRGYNRVDDFK